MPHRVHQSVWQYPVVISKFYENANEYDVDVVAHNGVILVSAISEHIEYAGVHSGDATMILPPVTTDEATQARILEMTAKLAQALNITGPMNVQFLRCQDGSLKVIEANVRAARSVPFVSKVVGIDFPEVMARAFVAKAQLKPIPKELYNVNGYYGCKASMFSWIRLINADPI
eukprot:PhF_6_TR1961/c0_g1_i2/m.3194